MSRFYAIEVEGKLTIHVASTGGSYMTLCGLDGDDPTLGLKPAKLPRKPQVNCPQCFQSWMAACYVKMSDFTVEARS